jgi:hypothetical protein
MWGSPDERQVIMPRTADLSYRAEALSDEPFQEKLRPPPRNPSNFSRSIDDFWIHFRYRSMASDWPVEGTHEHFAFRTLCGDGLHACLSAMLRRSASSIPCLPVSFITP